MSSIITAVVAATAPLMGLRLLSGYRWRWVAGLVLLGVSISVGFGLGILGIEDLWVVPLGVGMGESLLLTLLWILFGAVARTAGPICIPGPPWLTAVLMGAGIGEVPAAAILSAGAKTPAGAARLALAAAGGGMVGRIGDPAMLVLTQDSPSTLLSMAPLGLLLAWLVRPSVEDLIAPAATSKVKVGLVISVAVVATLPGMTAVGLVVGILGLGLIAHERRGHIDLAGSVWQVCAVGLALLAVVGGAPELAAQGLEVSFELLGWLAPPLMVAASALLTAFTDSTAMALIAQAITDRSMALPAESIVTPLATGVAVGGLAPLIAAGAFRAGLKLWGLQVVVAVLWSALWALI